LAQIFSSAPCSQTPSVLCSILNWQSWQWYQLEVRMMCNSCVAAGLVAALYRAASTSAWMYITTAPTARHTWVAIGGREVLF
jgi:hypothetical protein